MSTQVADLFADLSLRTTQFSAGLNAAVASARMAGSSMSTAFRSPAGAFSEVDNAARSMSGNVKGYMKDVSRIVGGILVSQAFYGIISAIKEATSSVVEFSMSMEQAQTAFTFMMGSATEANTFLTKM